MRLQDVLIPVALAAATTAAAKDKGTQLSDDKLALVYQRMVELSTKSWENGTHAQASLEWDTPHLSVFSPTSLFPFPSNFSSDSIPNVFALAEVTLNNRPNPSLYIVNATAATATTASTADATATDDNGDVVSSTTSASASATSLPTWINIPAVNNTGLPKGSPLLVDDAAGDPASLGVAVLMAQAASNNAVVNGSSYGDAATAQLNFLLYDVPRTAQGVISHRVKEAQLWADNVYMVPPFIAFYGLVSNNQTLVDIAYQQISLYRDALRNQSSSLWQHTIYGGTVDNGTWATGNAWVVAGCVRVIATIQQSPFASQMSSQINDLKSWAGEILTGSQPYITVNGLLRNYITNDSSFEDSTSTALMASGGLRLSTLNLTNDYVNMSLTLLAGVSKKVNESGYVTQVTDPYTFSVEGPQSPEAQSFVLLAYAAYKQWVAQGSQGITKGKNPVSAASPHAATPAAGVVLALVASSLVWVLA